MGEIPLREKHLLAVIARGYFVPVSLAWLRLLAVLLRCLVEKRIATISRVSYLPACKRDQVKLIDT